jgi:hypothetical protein
MRFRLFGKDPGKQAGEYRQKARQAAQEEARSQSQTFGSDYDKWREEFSRVRDLSDPTTGERTTTGKRYDELAGLYTGDVDRGMYEAGSNVADAYARRGLSDSGYATGAQQDVISQAAAERARARQAAMKEAIGEGMQASALDLSAIGGKTSAQTQAYLAYLNMLAQESEAVRAQEEGRRQDYGDLITTGVLLGMG